MPKRISPPKPTKSRGEHGAPDHEATERHQHEHEAEQVRREVDDQLEQKRVVEPRGVEGLSISVDSLEGQERPLPEGLGVFAEGANSFTGQGVGGPKLAHRAPRIVKVEEHHLLDAADALDGDHRVHRRNSRIGRRQRLGPCKSGRGQARRSGLIDGLVGITHGRRRFEIGDSEGSRASQELLAEGSRLVVGKTVGNLDECHREGVGIAGFGAGERIRVVFAGSRQEKQHVLPHPPKAAASMGRPITRLPNDISTNMKPSRCGAK